MRDAWVAMAAMAAVTSAALTSPAPAQPNRTKVGTLACDISAGIGLIVTSKKNLACMFTPSQPGPREVYSGSITKYGLDLAATTGGEMIWGVQAPAHKQFGALAGHYGGAAAEAAAGAGVGANVLIGGSNRTVTLQPVSVQGQEGLNLAAGVAELDLRPAR